MPLSGEASSGGLTAKGADAFFKSTNAHKGVFNRKINYDYKDDAYDPAKRSRSRASSSSRTTCSRSSTRSAPRRTSRHARI